MITPIPAPDYNNRLQTSPVAVGRDPLRTYVPAPTMQLTRCDKPCPLNVEVLKSVVERLRKKVAADIKKTETADTLNWIATVVVVGAVFACVFGGPLGIGLASLAAFVYLVFGAVVANAAINDMRQEGKKPGILDGLYPFFLPTVFLLDYANKQESLHKQEQQEMETLLKRAQDMASATNGMPIASEWL